MDSSDQVFASSDRFLNMFSCSFSATGSMSGVMISAPVPLIAVSPSLPRVIGVVIAATSMVRLILWLIGMVVS